MAGVRVGTARRAPSRGREVGEALAPCKPCDRQAPEPSQDQCRPGSRRPSDVQEVSRGRDRKALQPSDDQGHDRWADAGKGATLKSTQPEISSGLWRAPDNLGDHTDRNPADAPSICGPPHGTSPVPRRNRWALLAGSLSVLINGCPCRRRQRRPGAPVPAMGTAPISCWSVS